jgi:hypothetical protein
MFGTVSPNITDARKWEIESLEAEKNQKTEVG